MSIRITADGFSFVITEASSGGFVCRESYPTEQGGVGRALLRRVAQSEACQFTPQRVCVVVDSESVCVPLADFRPEDLRQHYALVYGEVDFNQHRLCYSVLPELQVVEVFTVPRDVCGAVSGTWPEATYTSASSMVLNHAAAFCRERGGEGNCLFAYLEDRQFFLLSMTQGQLRYSNHFVVEEKQNALFFLLSVWKELSLDVFRDVCYLGGNALAQQVAEEARTYLQQVEWMGQLDLTHL